MIGHFVNNLTPFEEDRLLGGKLGLFDFQHCCNEVPFDRPGCVQQVAGDSAYNREAKHRRAAMVAGLWHGADCRWHHDVGLRYDRAVVKFGVPRIANAIRNRIFSNQVRRKLAQPQPEYATS